MMDVDHCTIALLWDRVSETTMPSNQTPEIPEQFQFTVTFPKKPANWDEIEPSLTSIAQRRICSFCDRMECSVYGHILNVWRCNAEGCTKALCEICERSYNPFVVCGLCPLRGCRECYASPEKHATKCLVHQK